MIAPPLALSAYVRPALVKVGLYTLAAEQLLMGTAAVESNFTTFTQLKDGPARGMFQMEPKTFHDLFERVLSKGSHAALKKAVLELSGEGRPVFEELTTNHLFAAAMARVKYYSISAPIPASVADQAHYWWVHYNGKSPHGLKPADYVARWTLRCAELYPHMG